MRFVAALMGEVLSQINELFNYPIYSNENNVITGTSNSHCQGHYKTSP